MSVGMVMTLYLVIKLTKSLDIKYILTGSSFFCFSLLIGWRPMLGLCGSVPNTKLAHVHFEVNNYLSVFSLLDISMTIQSKPYQPQAVPTVPTSADPRQGGATRGEPMPVVMWLDCTECGSRLHSYRHQGHHHEV